MGRESDSDSDSDSSSSSSRESGGAVAESDSPKTLFRLVDASAAADAAADGEGGEEKALAERGYITYNDVRQCVKSARALILIRKSSLLQPLLLPRIFQAASQSLDVEDMDTKMSLPDFRAFVDAAFEISSIESAAENIFRLLRKEQRSRRNVRRYDDSSGDESSDGERQTRANETFSVRREELQFEIYRSEKIVKLLSRNRFVVRMLEPQFFRDCASKAGEFEASEGMPVQMPEFRRFCNLIALESKKRGPLQTEATWAPNSNAESFSALGKAAFEQGQYCRAASFYKVCVSIQPNNKTYRFALGCAEEKAGKLTQAVDAFESALSVDCLFSHAMKRLVECYEVSSRERTRLRLLGDGNGGGTASGPDSDDDSFF